MRKYLSLEVRSDLRDDISLLTGYANLHARKHLPQNSQEFSEFHDAINRVYGHLDTIDVAKSGRPAYLRAYTALTDLARLVESKRQSFQRRQERLGPQVGTYADGYLAALIEHRIGPARSKRA